MHPLFRRLVLVLVLLFAGVLPARAHDGPGATPDPQAQGALFINLTTDDPFRAWMALHFALSTRRMGNPVVVFLNVTGVRLASTRQQAPKFEGAQDSPLGYIRQLKQEGGLVLVCMPCLRPSGMTADDLVEGVLPAAPGLTQSIIFAEGARTLSW